MHSVWVCFLASTELDLLVSRAPVGWHLGVRDAVIWAGVSDGEVLCWYSWVHESVHVLVNPESTVCLH